METVPDQVASVCERLMGGYLLSRNGRSIAQLNPRARAPKRGFLVLNDVPVKRISMSDMVGANLRSHIQDYVHTHWLLASARPGYRVFALWADGFDFLLGIEEWAGSYSAAQKIARNTGAPHFWDIRLGCRRHI